MSKQASTGYGSAKCLSDCRCQRHLKPRCLSWCACGRHENRNSGTFGFGKNPTEAVLCKEGCHCGRHDKVRGYQHTSEAKAAIGEASRLRKHTRQPLTIEQRERISVATRAAMARPEVMQAWYESHREIYASPEYREKRGRIAAKLIASGRLRGPTKPQLALADFLRAAGFVIELEKQFDCAVVDIYLPDYHLAFEADGEFWHARTERERPGYYKRRDDFLLKRFRLPTVRISDVEIGRIAQSG